MKFILIFLLVLNVFPAHAERLDEISEILKFVESRNDPFAIGDGGASYGILQIQQVAIDDVNRRYGTQYKHEDAFNVECAEEIFKLYVTMWTEYLERREGREATTADIVRIWNGGPTGYKRDSTIKYLNKFKKNSYICKPMKKENKQKCLVGNKLGLITNKYTHTVDVYLFKSKKMTYGVHKAYVKMLPVEPPKVDGNQLRFNYEA